MDKNNRITTKLDKYKQFLKRLRNLEDKQEKLITEHVKKKDKNKISQLINKIKSS